ncbi:hypothetical protein QAD02_004651 [Eretmocerus hayati]|uniref:Uncharacterized protein n=1 Tax=Eretmocerus hayati TaxID=131215 RepID=A0ACC2NQ51_9HYME|nr:hypothetical protein QAD02_004651 [Eretmocerus hayati]
MSSEANRVHQCREQQVDDGQPLLTWRAQSHHEQYSYDMGRDSPGALLDMLAEVASQTLHSEKKLSELDRKKLGKTKEARNRTKLHQVSYNVNELLIMPASQLVKLFTVDSSNELSKQYTYSCALVPGCGQSYSSFASDFKAKLSIQTHLADHLEFLKNNADTYASFTATAVTTTKPKTPAPNKKTKSQPAKKPPKETPNKENKDTKVGKTTSNSRKVLTNEVNLKEVENNSNKEKTPDFKEIARDIKKELTDVKVLGDHSYVHVKDKKNNQSSTKVHNDPLPDENIMYMVVGANGVSDKDLTENFPKSVNAGENEVESMTLWKDDSYATPEVFVPAKPKGKAKFIGTSKEEREMALLLIEKIRKKGNPTGNNLQCRICDPPRTFTAPTTLVSHYRSHAGIKPYECRICRAVFTRRHSLKYHMLIHQNQTRFTCADCGKKFRHPSHFREHRRRHTGEAPFGCEDCGQRFKTRNTYKRHLKTRHGKVLTITGELLHLSEEDSKKVRTKNRKKKQAPAPAPEIVNTTEVSPDPNQGQEFRWDEQQVCDEESGLQHVLDDSLWMLPDNPETVMEEENYSEPEKEKETDKTDFNETEIEDNFEDGEVVIAQTDSDGTLHFEEYNYAQSTVYTDDGAIQFCEENVCSEITDDSQHFIEAGVEAIVEYEECTDDYAEALDPNIIPKIECNDDVYLLQEQVEEMEEEVDEEFDERMQQVEVQIGGDIEEQMEDEIDGHLEDGEHLGVEEQFEEFQKDVARRIKVEVEDREIEVEEQIEEVEEQLEEVEEQMEELEERIEEVVEQMEEVEEEYVSPDMEDPENFIVSDSCESEDVGQITMNLDDETLKIIKLCDNNGKTTLQLLKNNKIAVLGNNAQSINLVQNGKQHTIYLLATGDSNLLEIDNGIVEGSKSLPAVAVPAE